MVSLQAANILRRSLIPLWLFFSLSWSVATGEDAESVGYDKHLCKTGPHKMRNLYPDPDPQAPENFEFTWQTTVAGREDDEIVIQVNRAWSPHGVDRFYQLLLDGYFDCAPIFRVAPGYVVQLGIASEPEEFKKWDTPIPDDPVKQSNKYGYIAFAAAGPGSRTTQIFINLADNTQLDSMGFAPFAKVVKGMDIIEALYNPTPGEKYGITQEPIRQNGNKWILEKYPKVDLIQGLPQK